MISGRSSRALYNGLPHWPQNARSLSGLARNSRISSAPISSWKRSLDRTVSDKTRALPTPELTAMAHGDLGNVAVILVADTATQATVFEHDRLLMTFWANFILGSHKPNEHAKTTRYKLVR